MTFEEWWKKWSGGKYQPDNHAETSAAWDEGSVKYRKEIIRYRKALLEIANSECINPQDYALEVLKHDV